LDRLRIAYSDAGTGPAVVLVHGTPSHSYIWRNVVPGLRDAGYRTLVFDLLGYGLSERPVGRDTSVAAQVRVLERLLEARGIDRANLAGHDIGGAVAMTFALRNRERVSKLALIDPVSYDSWPSETWQEIIRNRLPEYEKQSEEEFREMMTRQLRMTVHDRERMTGEVLEAYLEPLSGALGRASFFEHQVRHYDSRYTREISGDLQKLSMPVRILWGEEDEWQPTSYARRLRRDIPNSELVVVPEAGHFLMEDAPERVTAELSGFFAEDGNPATRTS
jgi:pimeloyl-ACP methyl ester carboxylesterase